MDKPLGALDRKLREQMQFEISRLHRQLGFTVIYVTHDQTEALTMSNRVAVFDDGVVQQCAAPATLYERPANAFVADFIGENNFIPGALAALAAVAEATVAVTLAGGQQINALPGDLTEVGANCIVSVRPEKIFIGAGGGGAGGAGDGDDAGASDTGGVGTGAAGAGDGGSRGDSGARAPDNQVEATFMVRHYVGDFVRYYYELADGTEVTVKVLNDVAAPQPGARRALPAHLAQRRLLRLPTALRYHSPHAG